MVATEGEMAILLPLEYELMVIFVVPLEYTTVNGPVPPVIVT